MIASSHGDRGVGIDSGLLWKLFSDLNSKIYRKMKEKHAVMFLSSQSTNYFQWVVLFIETSALDTKNKQKKSM